MRWALPRPMEAASVRGDGQMGFRVGLQGGLPTPGYYCLLLEQSLTLSTTSAAK